MVLLSELLEESSSSSTTHGQHNSDVILSFRGIDTHLNFTGHLHEALVNVNIITFLDDEEMNKWKKALVAVANLKGKDAKDRQKTKFIEEINSILQRKHTKLFLEVEGLDLQASLQLLSYHVFKGNDPKEGYEEVSEKLMAYIHGVTILIDGCFHTIVPSNELKMHQLLPEMGRDVLLQKSPNMPWKPSRLYEESFNVLEQNKHSRNLKGLILDLEMFEKKDIFGSRELKIDALSMMDNLMLLQLNYVKFNGSYKNFPLVLRMENLVALDMSYRNLESFGMSYGSTQQPGKRQNLSGSCSKGKPLLRSLKILNLSSCKKLHSLGGFFEFPALERLILLNCLSLTEVCESIEQCDGLDLIDLSYCNEAGKLLRTICKVKNVKILKLDGCNLDKLPVEMRDDVHLPETLNGKNIGMNSLTSSRAIVDAIPRTLESYLICLPSSLVSLSLGYNNLSNESFPDDWSSLSMLKELDLYYNDIVSLPNCVKTLPRLEKLDVYGCERLKTLEHLPHTLKHLIYCFEYDDKERKILFNREMSSITIDANDCRGSLFEGMYKIEDIEDVEEEVLRSLGWTNLDFTRIQPVETGSKVEMIYEFGIFSTVYRGKEMPKWISDRREGSSISFTIPSSPNNLRGLNLCYVFTDLEKINLLWVDMRVINVTKGCTWIYHYDGLFDQPIVEDVVHLSHWMFGKNEMEDGDQITISISKISGSHISIRECGVSFVYDEEKDLLGYYKSWNHIIGGDLSPFQKGTGVYRLHQNCFLDDVYFDNYIGPQPFFKAFRSAQASEDN